ncbi:MAG TPA: hypothetical protein VKX17_09600 [Planctomycetota bacterium]|nr:hypothetical protein [Planctomycetota bacterium]
MRFSLATLILSAMLVAACATFWWNWSQWWPVDTHTSDYDIRKTAFAADNTRFYAHGIKDSDAAGRFEFAFYLHDAASGALLREIECKVPHASVVVSPDCKYLVLTGPGYGFRFPPVFGAWDLETGEDLLKTQPALSKILLQGFVKDSSVVLIQHADSEAPGCELVEFPSLKRIRKIDTEFSDAQILSESCVSLVESKSNFFSDPPTPNRKFWIYDFTGREVLSGYAGYNTHCIVTSRVARVAKAEYAESAASSGAYSYELVFKSAPYQHMPKLPMSNIYQNTIWTSDACGIVFVDAANSVRLHRFDTNVDVALNGALANAGLFAMGDAIVDSDQLQSWDAQTGALRYKLAGNVAALRSPPVADYWLMLPEAEASSYSIVSVADGLTLGTLTRRRWGRNIEAGEPQATFAHGTPDFVVRHMIWDRNFIAGNVCHSYTLWKQTKSDIAKRVASMPEFWIALALIAALIWNVRRNRKAEQPKRRRVLPIGRATDRV